MVAKEDLEFFFEDSEAKLTDEELESMAEQMDEAGVNIETITERGFNNLLRGEPIDSRY